MKRVKGLEFFLKKRLDKPIELPEYSRVYVCQD